MFFVIELTNHGLSIYVRLVSVSYQWRTLFLRRGVGENKTIEASAQQMKLTIFKITTRRNVRTYRIVVRNDRYLRKLSKPPHTVPTHVFSSAAGSGVIVRAAFEFHRARKFVSFFRNIVDPCTRNKTVRWLESNRLDSTHSFPYSSDDVQF